MKTILVPTDFSPSASNATLYAASLAKKLNAKILLFHSFHVPIPVNDVPLPMMSMSELEEENTDILNNEAKQIQTQYNIPVDILTKPGFALDDIHDLEKQKSPVLIVMGMKGAGKVAEVIIGSTATSVIRKAKTPVLLIPDNATFDSLEKIVLACDFKVDLNTNILSFLKELATGFKSEIDLVNVIQNGGSEAIIERSTEAVKIREYMGDLKTVYFFPHNQDFVAGMNDFLKKNKAGIISVIPHRHNLLERMFSESNTKRIAFHMHLPLLTLPDTHKSTPTYL